MHDWYLTISSAQFSSAKASSRLERDGFDVVPALIPTERMPALIDAYDSAEFSATQPDKRVGDTSTRVSDFVNRGAEFDDLYLMPALLDACCRIIRCPFKLSSLQSRTVHPHASAQDLHVDVPRDSADWPLVGFILMIDEFREDNGATRFVPSSHNRAAAPRNSEEQVLACGPAGSLLIYNGSTLHGHSASHSDKPRRSLQGAFIPREGRSGIDFAARMDAATRDRLSPLAKYLLCI